MESKEKAVTFDVDSTLAETSIRAKAMIDPDARASTDWLAYAKACASDTPTSAVALLRLMALHYKIILVTARHSGARIETLDWCQKYQIPMTYLMMNEDGMSPIAFKLDAIQRLKGFFDIVLHVDDWWSLREPMEALGVPCLIVRSYPPTADDSMAF